MFFARVFHLCESDLWFNSFGCGSLCCKSLSSLAANIWLAFSAALTQFYLKLTRPMLRLRNNG